MTTLTFAKGHGTGQDFVLITDEAGSVQLTPEQVRALCHRRTGIGADGLIRAVRTRAVPEGADLLSIEPAAHWFMDAWNAAGEPIPMSGNGIRVFVAYLLEEGLVEPVRGETIPIATRAGIRDVLLGAAGFTVDLGRWRLGKERLVAATGLDVARPGLGILIGEPHVVTALADEAELAGLNLDEAPRFEPELAGVGGAEFVVPADPFLADGVGHIHMRGHATGSGEAPSTGGGVAAAALAFRHWGGEQMPHRWSITTPGGRLAVRMFATEEGEHVSLSGPAEIVYRGSITLE